MVKSFRKVHSLYIFIDLILISISFYLPYFLRYNFSKDAPSGLNLPNPEIYLFIFIIWAIFIVISFKNRNLYATDRGLTIPREIFKVVGSIFYTSILIAAIIFFSKLKLFSRSVFFGNFFALCLILSGFRIIKRLILRRMILQGFHNLNILIVGAGRIGKIILEEIRRVPLWGFRAVGFLDDNVTEAIEGIPILGKVKDFSAIAKRFFIDEVVVTIPSEINAISQLIKEAKELRLGLKIVPQSFEDSLPSLDVSYLGFVPLMSYKERRHHPAEFAAKRIFDFVISLISLIISIPLFVAFAIAIKIDSPGPIFYKQMRSGFKGKTFALYKFRSMVKNAETLKAELLEKNEVRDGVIFKIKDDPRITRVGRFLRRFSLDELPQLFNVLKGDMSLVGPRPPIPGEVEEYSDLHMERLILRPGMTGLSQVKGRSELTFRKWVKWDLWYINNWSFGLDLQILWWTFPSVLKGKGAY